MRKVAVVLATAALLAGCGLGSAPDRLWSAGTSSDASCAALLEYDGDEYGGHGDLKRQPATTGRVETGVAPGCDDGNGEAPDRQVRVAELADLPMDRAVLVEGSLYVRTDLPFPESARPWFVPPSCHTRGSFELQGDWISVQGPKEPRFDGDLRMPYRLGVRVTGGPVEYRETTIQVHVDERTAPTLGPDDVNTSLWEGGGVVAEMRCEKR